MQSNMQTTPQKQACPRLINFAARTAAATDDLARNAAHRLVSTFCAHALRVPTKDCVLGPSREHGRGSPSRAHGRGGLSLLVRPAAPAALPPSPLLIFVEQDF